MIINYQHITNINSTSYTQCCKTDNFPQLPQGSNTNTNLYVIISNMVLFIFAEFYSKGRNFFLMYSIPGEKNWNRERCDCIFSFIVRSGAEHSKKSFFVLTYKKEHKRELTPNCVCGFGKAKHSISSNIKNVGAFFYINIYKNGVFYILIYRHNFRYMVYLIIKNG